LVNALKQWKLTCPKGELGLVLPNEKGRIESHRNTIPRAWQALQLSNWVTRSCARREAQTDY
jgi:integrase